MAHVCDSCGTAAVNCLFTSFLFFDSIKRKKDLILRSTVSQLNVYD